MPKLCKLVTSSSRTLSRCPKKTKPTATKKSNLRMKRAMKSKSFDDHLSDWVVKKKEMGAPESKLFLPFLVGAPKLKLAECRICENIIYPEEEACCSTSKCKVSYHSGCASDRFGSSEDIKCPQHECFHCKKKSALWRCSRCDLASHEKCAPFPEYVIRSDERPGEIICWRHSTDSPPIKCAVPASSIQEVFGRLTVPYVEKEFKFDPMWRDSMPDHLELPSYVQPSVPISSIEEVFRFLMLSCVEEEFKIDPKWTHTKAKKMEPPSYVHITRSILHLYYLKGRTSYNRNKYTIVSLKSFKVYICSSKVSQ
ncbi:putative [histone H3]-lysine(4) N-trimethyltransferase chromatin regulator PHD family [Helianthus annuus]|nr:putative [histone H3]-lysine(4) N-trimethyltransferase chromatin regulator PHD family [Helianthus annuus]